MIMHIDGERLKCREVNWLFFYLCKGGCIPRFDRGADGGINPASVFSSWGSCSAPERLGFFIYTPSACG
ncbi:hypothetical protein R84B8_01045 [Treponema sp. R8-4-B8]